MKQLRDGFLASLVLVLLGVAVYQKALWFVPSDADDLRILSSVSQTRNVLSYFVSDWGMENTYVLADGHVDSGRRSYRPLHSISIWAGYQVFGVSAFPNQLLNLLLHLGNALILLRILRRIGLDLAPAFLVGVLGLISLYTASPAIWVSDRQTLVVGTAFLLLVLHFLEDGGRIRGALNLPLVAALTVSGLLFKESGLLIPLVAAAFVLLTPYSGPRWRDVTVCILFAASYAGLRVLLFGSNAFSYAAEGIVFGTRPYALLSDLPWHIGLWARFETVLKNFLCVFLPIFDPAGRIQAPPTIVKAIFWWLPTLLLTATCTGRRLTRLQLVALTTIAINAALHMQVFRYRVEYISQFAFCLYIAASPVWNTGLGPITWMKRQRIALACSGLLALVGITGVNRYVHTNWSHRQEELANHRLSRVAGKYPISDRVVADVLTRYAPARFSGNAE